MEALHCLIVHALLVWKYDSAVKGGKIHNTFVNEREAKIYNCSVCIFVSVHLCVYVATSRMWCFLVVSH